MLKKILVANRGEIAVRIIRACREMGIIACTIYSEADAGSVHARLADEAYPVGPPEPENSYLNISKIISIAKENYIDAIHPGYGFLAENSEFIEEVEKSGIIFIGPSSGVVKLMGDKLEARKFIKSIGVPYVPGAIVATDDTDQVLQVIEDIGYPVILKAAAGGGGKGMRIIEGPEDIASSLERAKSESLKAFNDDRVYIEKYISNPKHIEVQLLSDGHGNHLHLFERECSIQRRYQKVIEEAPSSSINTTIRKNITDAALKVVKACNYANAGTIEFLLDSDDKFYFLEMNTRLQVEHPVTEAVTGIDIVKEQIKIAGGEKIGFGQDSIALNGYAIECRINSEDPYSNFMPSSGNIRYFSCPAGKDIRVDSGVSKESEITLHYDSLLAKLIVHSDSRSNAITIMKNALSEFKIAGIITNLPVHKWTMQNEEFISSTHSINTLENNFNPDILLDSSDKKYIELAAALGAYMKSDNKALHPKSLYNSISNNWTENG